MSSQLQDEAHAIALEADRQRVQDELDAIQALYDQPCCKVTARICYLQGRLDRAQETFENETERLFGESKGVEQSTGTTKERV